VRIELCKSPFVDHPNMLNRVEVWWLRGVLCKLKFMPLEKALGYGLYRLRNCLADSRA